MELVDDISILDEQHYAKHEHLENLREDAANLLKRINSYIKYLNTEAAKLLAQKGKRTSKRARLAQLPITNYQLPTAERS